MVKTLIFVVILGAVFMGSACAQYHVSSNEKIYLASAPVKEQAESASTTVQKFFLLAKDGQRSEWEKLLARNCFDENIIRGYANDWYKNLVRNDYPYHILKITSPKTNQKIVQYSSDSGSSKKKTMVLVREKGQWKVYHADI
jgi:hypothetical protein